MPRDQQTGRARGLRGETETAGGELCLDLDLRERGDQRPALKPLFQSPGGVLRGPRLDDENKRGVEAECAKARSVRAPPFTRGVLREAPQHEAATLGSRRLRGDHGKGEGKGGWPVAVGGRLDLVESPLLEPMQGKLPPPSRGRAREGGNDERKGAGGVGRGRARYGGKA
jgi:hypothetical protein